jgi:hypothetical protein
MSKEKTTASKRIPHLVGLPWLEEVMRVRQEILEKLQESPVALFEGSPYQSFLRSLSDYELFCRGLLESAQAARRIPEQLENRRLLLLWKTVIKSDDEAAEAFLSCYAAKQTIKNEICYINRVKGLKGSRKLSDSDGKSLAYLAIMDARQYYKRNSKSKRYWEDLPSTVLVAELRKLYRRAFWSRLITRISKELQTDQHPGLVESTYVHPETGEAYLFLKDAARELGLEDYQLRYLINTGVVPTDCHCRFDKFEPLGYYHTMIRRRVPAIMIPLSKMRDLMEAIERQKAPRFDIGGHIYITITQAAKFVAEKRGIQIPSAKKNLKRNKEFYGAKFHKRMWAFPLSKFTRSKLPRQ